MNITGQFQQIEIFLADDRLVAVLKEMAPSLVAQVEVDRVAGHQAPHAFGKGLFSGPDQQVKMVGYQGPGVYGPSARTAQFRQPGDEVLPVSPGSEYLAGLDPPGHDVMQGPGGIQPRLSGHLSLNIALNGPCQVYSETTSPITEVAGRFQVLGQQGPFHGDDLVEPPVQVVFPGNMGKHLHLTFADFLPALIGSDARS